MANNQDLTEADIDAMKTSEVYKLLEDFGVDAGNLNDPKKAKTAFKQKVQELREEAKQATSPEQVAEMMASTAESYRAKRELLLQRCRDVIAYLPTLDQSDRKKLTLRFRRDVMEILGEVQEHLSKDDCPILVAGETSSGKSMFLNLLLGENILPVAHLSSTSIICEVKYGETRQAVVHLREADPKTGSHQIPVTLGSDPEECRQQLKPYIHLKKRETEILPPATKVEIFWPLTFLKGGVTIVDSPGVGESEMMDDIIAKYIPSAFAFIYVIDSSRAGGVQRDRLGRLLQKCKDYGVRSEPETFDPTKAIFVCNKWDLVPKGEREEVKEDTIQKLGEMWHGLDESRLFTYSNTEAVKAGFRSADFNKLLDGIYELLPESLNHKLFVQYRKMADILKEALPFIKLKLNDAYRNLELDAGEQRKAYEEVLARFEETAAHTLKEKKDFLEDAVNSAVTILDELLQGDELKKHLSNVPIKAGTKKDALKELKLKTDVYLTSHQQFQDHVNATSKKFREEFQALVTKVSHDYDKNIRPVIGLSFLRQDFIMTYSTTLWFLWVIPFLIITFNPILMLVTVPISTIFLGVTALAGIQAQERSWLCNKVISAFRKDKKLYAIAKRSLRWPLELLDDFESDLEANRKLFEHLLEERLAETRSQMELVNTYEPQVFGITLQLGRLAMVELAEMREYEFELDNIIGWPDPQNRIAGGSYGEVFLVQVQRDGAPVRAALKVGVMPYDITTDGNALEFLTEEDNLRKLKGDHIVEYYGTACKRVQAEGLPGAQPYGLRLGLVMELCEGTLESKIIGQREHNPATWGHDPVMKQRAFSYIQDKAIQLCKGLRTIHDAGYIHRDLKLINILVAAGDIVKLADVGLTKREVDVTGTTTGTATYAAPEVKERKIYGKSADIYSLGLILWEMWYGRTVNDRSLKGLTEGESGMIPEWETLVRDCVSTDASKRPKALECLRRIRDMTTEDSSQPSMLVSTV